MSQWPKVSVAVVTYQQKDFLRECLESILVQDYPDVEVVVADDASTDGTQEMLLDYEKRHPGVFKLVLAETNGGITANHNRAFAACTGKYVALIGGDDLMLPGRLEKQALTLEENEHLAVCATAADIFDSETGATITIGHSVPEDGSREYGPGELVRSANCIYASTAMVRRSMCPENLFDSRVPMASDFLFWVETLMNGRARALQEVSTRYRRHASNAMSRIGAATKDWHVTLRIIEEKYPSLAREVEQARSKLQYRLGVRYVRVGDYAAARAAFGQSFPRYKPTKTLAYLVVLSAPSKLRENLRKKVLFKSRPSAIENFEQPGS